MKLSKEKVFKLILVIVTLMNLMLILNCWRLKKSVEINEQLVSNYSLLIEETNIKEKNCLAVIENSIINNVQLNNSSFLKSINNQEFVPLNQVIKNNKMLIYYFSGSGCNQCIDENIRIIKDSQIEKVVFIGRKISSQECKILALKNNIDINKFYLSDSLGFNNLAPLEDYIFQINPNLEVTRFYTTINYHPDLLELYLKQVKMLEY